MRRSAWAVMFFASLPLLTFALAQLSLGARSASARVTSVTYTLNSTLDENDADPTDGKCLSFPSFKCTLRAAITQANYDAGPDTIVIPNATYTLTRTGYDNNNVVGDLDISKNMMLQGAGSGATIIDGNGSVTQDRVFEILSSATQVTLTNITIRNGKSLSSTVGTIGGGGLLIEGTGNLNLSGVIFDSNKALNGGGIYAYFSAGGGSIEMNNVVLHANTAIAGGVGAGGGAFIYVPSSSSRVTIANSQIYSNTADGTGGGLYVSGANTAQWSVQHSEIYLNTATAGGAIGNFAPLTLSDSRLHNNSVTADGGAIEAFSPLAVSRTTFDSNSAGRFGGAIFDLQEGGNLDFDHIVQSTLSNNWAQYGGAIAHDGYGTPGSLLTLLNSTVSGNGVYRPSGGIGEAEGAGIWVYSSTVQLWNTTIANNMARSSTMIGHAYSAIGGGVYITVTSTFTAVSSIFANNTHGNGIIVSTEDDCFANPGTVGELAYDLILDTSNCYVTGPQIGNIVGQDPMLAPLWTNGGSTQTQALRPGSPAIDAGAMTGCTDDQGNPLTIDQRGSIRPFPVGGRCDIGAFEFRPYVMFFPLIQNR